MTPGNWDSKRFTWNIKYLKQGFKNKLFTTWKTCTYHVYISNKLSFVSFVAQIDSPNEKTLIKSI